MKKTFVLDTSVLVHEPNALLSFEDNDLVIPIGVFEEIDGQKKRQDEVGRNARRFSAMIDKLRDSGQLCEGVPLGEKLGKLRVELATEYLDKLPRGFEPSKIDNHILAVAMMLKDKTKEPVVLVSKDINMRIKADALGIKAEDYETDKIQIDDVYTGCRSVKVNPLLIDDFYNEGFVLLREEKFYPQEMIILEDNSGSSKSALTRNAGDGHLVPLRNTSLEFYGIKARNKEQRFALDLLLDDDIKLVTLIGQAGTGKTLLALAAGLYKVMEETRYRKLCVARPIIPLGNDIGFLPGDVNEKLRPWMQPIFDNLEFLFNNRDTKEKIDKIVNSIQDMNMLELEPLTYIRGRSMPNQFLLIDEAQNLSPHEVQTIITRAGEDTKIVFTGDPHQIDHPYLDSSSNGLTFLVERFKNEKISGHINLTKGERSELAELGASLLGR